MSRVLAVLTELGIDCDAQLYRLAVTHRSWAYENGGKQAEELDYVPLPKALTEQIESYWQAQVKL